MTQPTDPTSLSYSEIIKQTLAQWGLDSLGTLVDQLGRTGASNDEISLRIQQSPEYAARFAGNAARVKSGLAPLSPAEYIALEGQYRQITSQLPPGFYDSKQATDQWIGGDVSPAELSQRVQDANQAWVLAPPEARQAWMAYNPGVIDQSHAIASILDTTTAEPLIQQRVQAAGIGGAALASGLALTNSAVATRAAQNGVTIDQARQAYQGIAQRIGADQGILGRFNGGQPGQTAQQVEEQAVLLGNTQATQQLKTGYAAEQALFKGHGGANDQTNAPGANY